jgi:hypothetical protein
MAMSIVQAAMMNPGHGLNIDTDPFVCSSTDFARGILPTLAGRQQRAAGSRQEEPGNAGHCRRVSHSVRFARPGIALKSSGGANIVEHNSGRL